MAVDKQVVITITVLPLAKGKRKVIVSGAPAGEMPAVHSGEFAQVHQLINTTWAELMKRKSQVPKLAKQTVTKAEPAKAEGDHLVTSETDTPEAEPEPAAGDLPVIEGDTQETGNADTPTEPSPSPLLSSLEEVPPEEA